MTFVVAIVGRLYYSNEYHRAEIYPRLERGIMSVILGFMFWLSSYPERAPILGQFQTVQLFFNSHVFWHLLVFVCEYEFFWICFDLNLRHDTQISQ